MAYYFIFPEKDATIYSQPDRKELNTGRDEILELLKERGTNNQVLYPSRFLVKFKNEDIKEVIRDTVTHDGFVSSSTTVNLELTNAEGKGLVDVINIVAYAVSQSWNEGTGRWTHLPTSSNGVTWVNRINSTDATAWTTTDFGAGSSGSISSSLITTGGGSWYTGSDFFGTQQLIPGDSLDIDIDVTTIVKKWSASLFNDTTPFDGIPNEGFLLKKPDPIEENVSHSFGYISYFSVDTHTIYPPKLTFKWNDQKTADIYTSSISHSLKNTTDDCIVTLYGNKEEYNQNDVARFRLHVRDKYPTRTFATSSNYLNVNYLQSSSHYSIRDAHSEEEIIPFSDDYTALSADSKGMYFNVYMKGLQPERYYRVLFRNKDEFGSTIYDDNYFFKVVR